MNVLPRSDGQPHGNGEAVVVQDLDGQKYWCRRVRQIAFASWCELDVFMWIESYGWDVSEIRGCGLLSRIDAAMKVAGL